MAWASGWMAPPAAPCSTRKTMMANDDGANAQSSEVTANAPTAAVNSVRVLKRRRSQPVSGATTAVAHR